MRLAFKFALSFVIVTVVVWGTASYFRVEREIGLFESDIKRDHESLGLDLAAAVADFWRLGGEPAARSFVQKANESKGHVLIDLLPMDSVPLSPAIQHTEGLLPDLSTLPSRPIAVLYDDSLGNEWVYTYVSVAGIDDEHMVIELAESLAEKDSYIASTVRRAILYTVVLGLLAGSVAMLLGMVFIARPTRSLVSKARRIAEGDLRGDVRLKQRDELGELAVELNAMSTQLAEAHHQVAMESAARESTVQQLRHADRLTTVGKLAAAVAHELGTPLNVIKARARMISEREIDGESAVASSKTIVEQSDRMSRIIRDLLDFSRRSAPKREPSDLRLIVNQTLDLIAPIANKSNVKIMPDVGSEVVDVAVDTDQIRQVIMNVLVNALEAMPNGGQLRVDLAVCRNVKGSHGDVAVVRISDTGRGIHREDVHRLFDPFFTTKDRSLGTGLGLSISADIIREHGGRIEVVSALGQGSTFSLYLPADSERGVAD